MKGIVDGGISMPVSEESLPKQERITGQHIAEYAGTLKENQVEYNSRFSAILKNGLSPEDYPSHFQEIKSRLAAGKPAEKPVPKKAAEKEEIPFPVHKEKKEASTKEEVKKVPKAKKEPKKKEAKEEKRKEKKKAKGGKTKKK